MLADLLRLSALLRLKLNNRDEIQRAKMLYLFVITYVQTWNSSRPSRFQQPAVPAIKLSQRDR